MHGNARSKSMHGNARCSHIDSLGLAKELMEDNVGQRRLLFNLLEAKVGQLRLLAATCEDLEVMLVDATPNSHVCRKVAHARDRSLEVKSDLPWSTGWHVWL